jgi:hypothetical protein
MMSFAFITKSATSRRTGLKRESKPFDRRRKKLE